MAKITLIGAGSVVFAKNLISDILQFPDLSGLTISLMDIDPARLKTARLMAERVVEKLGVKARIEATADRRKAITGANYVICTIQVGGYRPGTIIDFEIPRKYGLRQTIGDTLGVGGVFRGLRTIPKVVEIARDIAEVGAPGCTFLNYTNPMAMLCMAVERAVGEVPTIGLCHSVQGTSQQLAHYAGLDYQHISYKVAGINHMAFFLEFKYRGKDAYPLLFDLLNNPSFSQDKVRFEMMRRLGYFVTESSEHQSEYTPYFIHHGDAVVNKFDIPIDEYLRRCESIIATWKKAEAELIGDHGDIVVNPQTHEYGGFIIHSIETNTPRVVYGNIPNTGLIENLPHRCCVEVPVLVDGQGLQPTWIGKLPPQLAALCRTNINVQELTVDAALSGKREHIYHAVMMDPHTSATLQTDAIWAMCDELIEAHQKAGLLGDYTPTVRNTGRSYAGIGDSLLTSIEPVNALTVVDGSPIEFELLAENRGDKPFKGKLTFEANGKVLKTRQAESEIAVGAGKTLKKRVTLKPAAANNLILRVLSTDSRVTARDYIFNPPRVVTVTPRGPTSIEIEFMANKLLTASMSCKDGILTLRGRVIDTAVRIDESSPWTASAIEFFLKPERGGVATQYFLLPRKTGVTVLDRQREPVSAIKFSASVDKGGYDFDLRCDVRSLKVQSRNGIPFYMDLIVAAGALGDAHGSCRVGWNGKLNSSSRSGHYALIVQE